MGQFSVEKPVAPGSVLSGNQHAAYSAGCAYGLKLELLLAVFGGSQDLTCMKEIKDCEMLDLGPHKDIGRAQLNFLSGDRSLHNLRGAEHRSKRGWGS